MIVNRRLESDQGVILYDEALGIVSPATLFDPARWAGSTQQTPGGRGSSLFIDADGRHWVWRHFRRGGMIGKLVEDHYLFMGESRVRSFQEWWLLAQLRTQALPVPRPVAARYLRHGPFYTADLMTARISDARPLSRYLQTDAIDESQWFAVGRCIRTFHDCGVYHADLNAHNILLESHGDVHLIDFDRGRLRDPGAWCEANLRRLHRSLLKVAPEARWVEHGWPHLRDGYSALED